MTCSALVSERGLCDYLASLLNNEHFYTCRLWDMPTKIEGQSILQIYTGDIFACIDVANYDMSRKFWKSIAQLGSCYNFLSMPWGKETRHLKSQRLNPDSRILLDSRKHWVSVCW